MIYDLELVIAYDYPSEVKDARHILRVRPSVELGQETLSTQLAIRPRPDETLREQDFFGNALDHVLLFPPHEALSVTMKARVKVTRELPDLDATPSVAEIAEAAFVARDTTGRGPMHYLGDSRIVRLSEPLTDYAREMIDPAAPVGAAMLRFAEQIRKDFTYKPGATTVDTPVLEAFAAREGVCQDFAHIMIASLRGIGVPAAYVSGFLRTIPPEGKPRLAGADAMHAWVNVWLGHELGWRGFDPTNAMTVLNDHVVVAVGRDYSDVAPIDGVLITAGPQKTRHSVDVVPVEDEGVQPGLAAASA
ncbi:transglutaminase domain-containing protein [Methylopila henanensis]|uniref:Transglutaminase domain-containing protein n=1 Tax=Methylopila henanensis TaxID=873516 RepID=A0ABW4K613_9HYPH